MLNIQMENAPNCTPVQFEAVQSLVKFSNDFFANHEMETAGTIVEEMTEMMFDVIGRVEATLEAWQINNIWVAGLGRLYNTEKLEVYKNPTFGKYITAVSGILYK